MIYECPQCRTPQEAGQTVCPHCRAEFDGPVPSDAVVPALEAASALETTEGAEMLPTADTPPAGEAGPGPMPLDPPALEAARLDEGTSPEGTSPEGTSPEGTSPEGTSPETPFPTPSGPAPYLTPPSYAPPPYAPPLSTVTSLPYPTPSSGGGPPIGRLTRALLIAFPIVLVLVLGGVYLAGTLNTEADVVPVPAPTVSAQAPPPAPAPDNTPVTLPGGSNTNDGADPHVKLLAGRWVSKSNDFYVFNPDGSGSRGSALNPPGDQPFLWGLVQNRLMLYGAKNETLRFNVGPDSDTVFLAPQTGHYVQYSRAKT